MYVVWVVKHLHDDVNAGSTSRIGSHSTEPSPDS